MSHPPPVPAWRAVDDTPDPSLDDQGWDDDGLPADPWREVPQEDDGSMSLVGHLEELRARLIFSLVVLAVGFCLCYAVSDRLLGLIIRTSPQRQFVFLDPTEGFFTHLRVAFWGSVLLVAPIWIHQVWAFVRPGLTRRERFGTRVLFPVVAGFFFGGVAFAYTVILPLCVDFLLGFASNELQPMISIGAYASFVLTFLLIFGAAFELPVAIFAAWRLGLVDAQRLSDGRPYFVVGTMAVSAMLTPPDIASQLLLGLPVWVLYELTLLLIRAMPDEAAARGAGLAESDGRAPESDGGREAARRGDTAEAEGGREAAPPDRAAGDAPPPPAQDP